MNRRFWTTWPFLCLLAFVFFASVNAPRAWKRAFNSRFVDSVGPEPSAWSVSMPESDTAAPVLDAPSPAPIPNSAVLAESPEALIEEPSVVDVPPAPREKQRVMAFAAATVQSSAPVSPATMVKSPESSPTEAGEDQASSPDRIARRSPAPVMLVKHLPAVTEEVASTPAADDNASENVWPVPQSLLDRLEELMGDRETSPWARETSAQLCLLGPAVVANSDESLMIVERLSALARDGDKVAASLEKVANPLLSKFRRAQHALNRRLDVWRCVLLVGGPERGAPARLDSRRLTTCLAQIDAILGHSAAGVPWLEYLKMDKLMQVAGQADSGDDSARRLGRVVFNRLTRADLSPQQKQFLAQKPIVELGATLNDWLSGTVDLVAMLRHIEAVEAEGLTSQAHALADDCRRLDNSPVVAHRALSRRVQLYYRNANVRVAVTEDLLNRMIPEREPEVQFVHDEVLGRAVHGQSRTSTNVSIKLIPDEGRLRMALQVKGLVSALTSSTAGPATFFNDSESTYVASKELELTPQGLKLWPADVNVNNDVYLRSLTTSLDPIPVVGSLIQEVARSQHEQSKPAMNREVERKVASRAKQQIDDEADARLSRVSQRLQSRFVQPFSAMSLGPTMVSAQTTDVRMTTRLRFASDEQLSGWTPRPQAPADSLLSIQLHQSTLNNIIEQMDLNGGTFTVAQLRQRIAQRFNRPELLNIEAANEDVVIRFADKDALRVQFQDGCMEISLSVASLSRSPHQWRYFHVRAFYRPEWKGQSVELTRDGVVRLTGDKLNTSAQIALRGIFSKTFSKEKPWKLLPEAFASHPQMAKVGITQCVLEDGWIGLAFGPARPESQPVVARRPDKEKMAD